MPCVYLPGPAPAVTVANNYLVVIFMYYKTEFIAILFGAFYIPDKVEFGGSFTTVKYTSLFI